MAAPEQAQEVKKGAAKAKKRPWFFDALFETHFLATRDNLYSNDVYSTLYLTGNYDLPGVRAISSLGRISLRGNLTFRYIADPGESGTLLGDMRLYYSHPFSFSVKGQKFGGRGYFYWTFPTSKVSQQEGNISRPTLLVAFSKQLPLGLTLYLRPFARVNWAEYAEKEGGNMNTKWVLGYDIQLTYSLPFHKRMSLGAGWLQDWYNKYASRDGYSQPWNSEYYWEVFAGYSIFTKPVSLDAYLALASGRTAISDGVYRFRFMERNDTEIYFSLSARY